MGPQGIQRLIGKVIAAGTQYNAITMTNVQVVAIQSATQDSWISFSDTGFDTPSGRFLIPFGTSEPYILPFNHPTDLTIFVASADAAVESQVTVWYM